MTDLCCSSTIALYMYVHNVKYNAQLYSIWHIRHQNNEIPVYTSQMYNKDTKHTSEFLQKWLHYHVPLGQTTQCVITKVIMSIHNVTQTMLLTVYRSYKPIVRVSYRCKLKAQNVNQCKDHYISDSLLSISHLILVQWARTSTAPHSGLFTAWNTCSNTFHMSFI